MSGAKAALLVCTLALLPGCREEKPQQLFPSGVKGVPVDSTKPGEIAEGEAVFGFPIPRDLRLVARMPDAAYARGEMPFEDVTNYVRARLVPKRIHTGPHKTVFELATVKGATRFVVQVEVTEKRREVELVVRDRRRTKKPELEKLNESERMKRVGLTRDGRAIDNRAE